MLCVHELEKLILLKCPYYPKPSIDSTQSLTQFQCHFIQFNHERGRLTNAGELDSDSGSNKTNGPAGFNSSTCPCLPSPSDPIQSSHPQFSHLSKAIMISATILVVITDFSLSTYLKNHH